MKKGIRLKRVHSRTQLCSLTYRQNKTSFYNFIVKEVLAHNVDLRDAQLLIDGKAENAYRRSLKAYLRQNLKRGRGTPLPFRICPFFYSASIKSSILQPSTSANAFPVMSAALFMSLVPCS